MLLHQQQQQRWRPTAAVPLQVRRRPRWRRLPAAVPPSAEEAESPRPPSPRSSSRSGSSSGPRQLDADRAIRLLRATRRRSEQLPNWLRRTVDFDDDDAEAEAAAATAIAAARQQQQQKQQQQQQQNGGGGGAGGAGGGRAAVGLRARSASDPRIKEASAAGRSWMGWWTMQDEAKERERRYRRAVFSPERWAAHRSSARYWRHFRGVLFSRTFLGLLQPMSWFALMALASCLWNTLAAPQLGAPTVALNDSALTLTAFSISLLLVFRTDASYARFNEALATWNDVRCASKDLARDAVYLVADARKKAALVRWTEAFSRALLVHCRGGAADEPPLEADLADVLLPHEAAAVAAVGTGGSGGAPSFVLQVLSELVEQGAATPSGQQLMLERVSALGACVAVCDKLLRCPLPLGFTRHTSRALFLWLSAFPWALWPAERWGVLPLTIAVSWLLLGIDEIGVQIEEPFGILALEDICSDIQCDIDAIYERQDLVTDVLAAGGVACKPRTQCDACGGLVPAGNDASDAGGSISDDDGNGAACGGAHGGNGGGSADAAAGAAAAAAAPAPASSIVAAAAAMRSAKVDPLSSLEDLPAAGLRAARLPRPRRPPPSADSADVSYPD